MKLKPSVFPLATTTVAFVILLIVLTRFGAAYADFVSDIDATNRTNELLLNLQSIQLEMTDAETATRGYLLTGSPAYLEPYEAAVQRSPFKLQQIARDYAGSDESEGRLKRLRELVREKLERSKAIVDMRKDHDINYVLEHLPKGKGKALMDELRQLLDEMAASQRTKLEIGLETVESRQNVVNATVYAGCSLLFLIVVASSWLGRRLRD